MNKQINKICSFIKPQIFERLGNNTYYYNYDILEDYSTVINKETQEITTVPTYSFIQIHLQGQPNYKDCVKGIIRKFITIDEEFDLINSYNSYTNKINSNSSIISEYLKYLNKLKEIKDKVKKDFELN